MNREANKEREIFAEALELPAENRAAFLKEACGIDGALLKRVQELLNVHSDESPVLRTVRITSPDAQKISEGPGSQIGRYKLLQQIGEGGMGIVYMAEQREPVTRKVALKIIKVGMDTRQVVARFEAERPALAMMDHPNIARVLDGGATDTGRPYFVMELVQGVPITEFCDKSKLRAQDRLKLFIQVCQAIQSAHQKGIIHRDIKPSNVLVTLHHGEPMPKVIDFGIAKATNQRLTEKTLFTQHASMIGTPAYMSPEQAEMSSTDVDTRADVYSLGVLLYELLTGSTPFPEKRLRSLGYGEIQRVIIEEEPERPSTRLSTLTNEQRSAVASNHGDEFVALSKSLRGDLDWIVMKCLEKDRTRRCDTANGLAADLKRHLENEPVTARPPSVAYRFQKSWRKNRLAYTAGLVVAGALVFGLGVSLWQTAEAKRLRRVAEAAQAAEYQQLISAQTAQELAEKASARAEEGEAGARRALYAANMNLAFKSVKENRLGRTAELLSLARPAPGAPDPRGWEWRYLWQLSQGDELRTLKAHTSSVFTIAYSPDPARRILGSGSWDRTVRLWNTRDYQPITTLPHQAAIESLAFTSTGEWLAVLTAKRQFDQGESQVCLWRMDEQPQLVHRFGVDADSDSWWRRASVTFSPDDSLLVVGQGNGEILIYDYKGKSGITSFQAHPRGAAINALAFSRDNRWLASAGKDQTVKLWRWQGGRNLPQLERELSVHDGRDDAAVLSLQFDPTARWLAAGGVNLDGSDLKVWDAHTGEPAREFGSGIGFIAQGLAFTPNGRHLITAAGDQWLRFWDTTTWAETGRVKGHNNEIWSVAISPTGDRIATGGKDDLIKIWDAERRGRSSHATKIFSGLGKVVFSRDSSSFLTIKGAANGRNWKIFRSDDVTEITELKLGELEGIPENALRELNIDLAGRMLVIADSSGNISVWDITSSERILMIPASEPIPTRRGDRSALVLSPNASHLAIQSKESEVIRVLKVRSGEQLVSLRFTKPQWPVTFSPDGRYLMACEPAGLVLWDLRTSKSSQGPGGYWAAFSPDGNTVATTGYSGIVTLLQVTAAGLQAQPRHRMNPDLRGLFEPCFSPNGDRLAVPSGSGVLWLCDPRIGQEQEVGTLEFPVARGSIARFSPNGNNLFVYAHQTLYVFEAPSFSEIERLIRAKNW